MSQFSSAAIGAAVAAVITFFPAGAGTSSLTVSASAPNNSGTYQVKAVKLSLADADAATAEGAVTVLKRIKTAARMVCGEREGQTMTSQRAKVFETCLVKTVDQAVAEVNAPELTKLAASR